MDETGKKGPGDTGERRVREAAHDGALAGTREAIAAAQHTPPPLTTERVFDIAEQVFNREMPGHRLQCITDEESGPVCRMSKEVGRRIDAMEATIEGMKLEHAEERGANREIARDAARATTLRAAVISAALSLAVGLGLFALNRMAPPRTPAAQVVQVGAKAP